MPQGILAHLKNKRKKEGDKRISAKGHRKNELQKDIKCHEEYPKRQEKFNQDKQILKGRPRYSKTDHDAASMQMKESPMKMVCYRPDIVCKLGVEGEFIVTASLFSQRSEALTLLPLLQRLEEKTQKPPARLVAGSDYEREENYANLQKKRIEAYAGNQPSASLTSRPKHKSGFVPKAPVYQYTACGKSELKDPCTKPKRGRIVRRSKAFLQYRAQSHRRIISELGTQLRRNRSIQSEGTFGVLKGDWGFRRFPRKVARHVFTPC